MLTRLSFLSGGAEDAKSPRKEGRTMAKSEEEIKSDIKAYI